MLSATSDKLLQIREIRELLRDRFPGAHGPHIPHIPHGPHGPHGERRAGTPSSLSGFSGIGILDRLGIACGGIAEAVSQVQGRGSCLLLGEVIAEAGARCRPVALIDACDVFDPQSLPEAACRSLLWVRCRSSRDAVKAADLLLRDGNLTLILMDLERCPLRELQRIPCSSWHRLRMLAEQAGSLCLACTPAQLIPRAGARVHFQSPYPPEALETPRALLGGMLAFRVVPAFSPGAPELPAIANSP